MPESPLDEQSIPLREGAGAGDWSVDDAFGQGKSAVGNTFTKVKNGALLAWSKTTKKMRATVGIIIFTIVVLSLWQPPIPTREQISNSIPSIPSIPNLPNVPDLPSITFDYGNLPDRPAIYNESKVAFLVENRPNPILASLVLHFISVVPPDWRFRFMGSLESVHSINQSLAIRNMVDIGKLDLTYIPANMSTAGQEMISRFLTNLWLYETVLQPAKVLLVFQTDSMICANSRSNLNEWSEFDWVGSPWNPNGQYGGNGGLSIRNVGAIIEVLRQQTRADNTEPEDVWLTQRLGTRPGANMANGTISMYFSGEMHGGKEEVVWDGQSEKDPFDHGYIKGIDDWRNGFYEPMGYHTGGSGDTVHGAIWGTPAKRKHIWDYCPEMKLTLEMDAAYYVPGECNNNWKRNGDIIGGKELCERGGDDWRDYVYRRGFDENGYPYLPSNIVPW